MFPLSTSTAANWVRLTACLPFLVPATLSGQSAPASPLRQREVIEDLSPETLARVAATYAQRQHYSAAAVPAPVIPLQLAQSPLPASQILPLPSPAASVAPPESSSLHLVQPPAELDPSSVGIHFDPVTITSDDGARLEAWLVPMYDVPVAARAARASVRTLDGPEPNRPSAGSRSGGIVI